jgi:hypothetical protein
MLVTVSTDPDRYEPLPSLGELPSFLLRKLSRRGRQVAWVVGALVVAGAVLIAFLVVPHNRSNVADRDAKDAQAAAARKAALQARWQREARPLYGRGPAAPDPHGQEALGPRRALVAGLEEAVTADAAARAQRGEQKGHYRRATTGPRAASGSRRASTIRCPPTTLRTRSRSSSASPSPRAWRRTS